MQLGKTIRLDLDSDWMQSGHWDRTYSCKLILHFNGQFHEVSEVIRVRSGARIGLVDQPAEEMQIASLQLNRGGLDRDGRPKKGICNAADSPRGVGHDSHSRGDEGMGG